MQAAEVHSDSSALKDSKSFSRLVIDSLKRAYEGLLKDPSIKTQKGKKNLARTLLALEEQILKKMNDVTEGGLSDEDTKKITDAIEEMDDELKIDSLADEYTKKKNAVRSSEDRILRFMKKKGMEDIGQTELREKLAEGGISDEEWNELLLRSGVHGTQDDSLVGVGAAVGHLAALLVKMEDRFVKNKPADSRLSDEELNKTVHEVDQEVTNIVVRTEKKIENLVDTIRADRAAGAEDDKKEGKQPTLSRAKLLELLAEAVQELCQPLSVINCSIDMIKSNALGAVTEPQKEMLELASSNGERVVKLVNKLMEISGVPKTMKPDAGIQAALY
jgi:hypothetical protein